jgi:rhamnogalacturonyl hydrolase YesR
MQPPSTPRPDPVQARRLADALLARYHDGTPATFGPYTLDLALEATAALFDATGDRRYRREVLDVAAARGWGPDTQPAGGSPPFTLLIDDVHRLSDDERYAAPFVEATRDYARSVRRSGDGLVLHARGQARGGGHAALIDSLQEYATRLAKAGSLGGGEAMFAECVEQYERHASLLRDERTGLWHQGAGWSGDGEVSPGAWSRGQGWLIRGMVRSLSHLPAGSDWTGRLGRLLEDLAGALVAVQDGGGMWHALVDHPLAASPPESSGTGLIARSLGRAVREGFLPARPYRQAALRAMRALHDCVGPAGEVLEACPGPGPLTGEELGAYLVEGFAPGDDHGVGAIVLALAEEIAQSKSVGPEPAR